MINPRLHNPHVPLNNVYKSQTPSSYLILNDFLEKTVITSLVNESKLITEDAYDRNSDGEYDNHKHSNLKRGVRDINKLPTVMKLVCQYFNSRSFMKWLRNVTGNPDLVPDDSYHGGGFHHTLPGGHLEVHKDFSYHEGMKMWRKVNLLIYLNEGWMPNQGGELEIWDKKLKVKHAVVDPSWNRAVIFDVDGTPHGHPTKTTVDRRSLAFYYYDKNPVSEKTTRAHWREGDKLV
tara:strand:- start:2279 stop:2980 length:702 start_codon:yes stop_codon:yes gene_type:complete